MLSEFKSYAFFYGLCDGTSSRCDATLGVMLRKSRCDS